MARRTLSRIRTRAPRAAPRRMTPTGTSSFRLPMNGKWLHMAYSCLISDSSIIMTTERGLQWFALQPCQAPPPQPQCRTMPTRLTHWASIWHHHILALTRRRRCRRNTNTTTHHGQHIPHQWLSRVSRSRRVLFLTALTQILRTKTRGKSMRITVTTLSPAMCCTTTSRR